MGLGLRETHNDFMNSLILSYPSSIKFGMVNKTGQQAANCGKHLDVTCLMISFAGNKKGLNRQGISCTVEIIFSRTPKRNCNCTSF